MSNSSNNFNVPALSLSSSRAKKQYGSSIPTRDYQIGQSNITINQNDINVNNRNEQYSSNNGSLINQKNRRPPIFPPKNNGGQKLQGSQVSQQDLSSKDLNKNVYLQKLEDIEPIIKPNQFIREIESSKAGLRASNSRKGLLKNPQSSRVIQEQVSDHLLNKKVDINKVLFDRRLNKLFEEANFFDEQLQSVGKDEIGRFITQLQQIKDANLSGHKDILLGLNALIL